MTAIMLSPQVAERITRSHGWRQRRIEVFDTASGKVLVKGQRLERHPALDANPSVSLCATMDVTRH